MGRVGHRQFHNLELELVGQRLQREGSLIGGGFAGPGPGDSPRSAFSGHPGIQLHPQLRPAQGKQ